MLTLWNSGTYKLQATGWEEAFFIYLVLFTWFKPTGSKVSSAEAAAVQVQSCTGMRMVRNRDCDSFALQLISSSAPKETLQQNFFFSPLLFGAFWFTLNPLFPFSSLLPSHTFCTLFSSCVPMAESTFHFVISYHVCSSTIWQETSWPSSGCLRSENVPVVTWVSFQSLVE